MAILRGSMFTSFASRSVRAGCGANRSFYSLSGCLRVFGEDPVNERTIVS